MTKTERYNTALPSSDNVKDPGVKEKEAKGASSTAKAAEQTQPAERGGPKGPEPTRYGDWEAKGRCTDF
ncbi:MAG: DUF1674 domain-containing protein [Candidatus Puniceispirillaceae bacterium]|jgi:hypothetical protein